ncbi:hypothetical protein C2845_PM06G32030 [Panicum miliaceum]|uniref:DUF6598 domain-containing protein n=1 Tax=Panicum miliaceum TaxID=4540 RepID=A0A3L6RC84_PANMI|nr:hypothetical protein C2845_PM06G32030 [Panicum miliaceum]
METEEGGGSSVTSSPGGSDKSRQPSPPTPPDGDEDSSESTSIGNGDEWLVSDEDADCENTARDTIEPLRNYVYRREINSSEDEYVKRNTVNLIMKYGCGTFVTDKPRSSHFNGIPGLIEFELRVRTEGRPDEDEPKGDCLIEGCTNMLASDSFIEHRRLYGDNCALDAKFAVLINAVEARIDVEVLSLGAIASGMNLKVYAKTSGFSEVIRLFEGASPKPGVVMSFVVAVDTHNYLDVYIEGSSEDNPVLGRKEKKPASRSWWKCSVAVVSVNVNWKSYRKKESLRE